VGKESETRRLLEDHDLRRDHRFSPGPKEGDASAGGDLKWHGGERPDDWNRPQAPRATNGSERDVDSDGGDRTIITRIHRSLICINRVVGHTPYDFGTSRQKNEDADAGNETKTPSSRPTEKTHRQDPPSSTTENREARPMFPGVAGMEHIKQKLKESIVGPLRDPAHYRRFNVSIPNGLLLYGPPGCGKTFIIQQMAKGLRIPFHEIKQSDLASTYVHGTVQRIGKTFQRALRNTPAILFLDEIESFTQQRGDLPGTQAHRKEEVDEFLNQLDSAGEKQLLVVGATNEPQLIDDAILRSGRLDQHLFVGPPDQPARLQILKLYVKGKNRPHEQGINFPQLASEMQAYSCSDIKYIVEEAARIAASRAMKSITEQLLKSVIDETSPSIDAERLEYYKDFNSLQSEQQVESAKQRAGFL